MNKSIIFINKLKKTFLSIIVLYVVLIVSFINSLYVIDENINSEKIYILSIIGNPILVRSVLPVIVICLIISLEHNNAAEIYCLIRSESRKKFFITNYFQNILMMFIFYFTIPVIGIVKLLLYNIDIFSIYNYELFVIIKISFSYFFYLIIFYCVYKLAKTFINSEIFSIIIISLYYIYTVAICTINSFKFGITNYLFKSISIGTNEIFIRTTIYFLIIIVTLTIFTFYIYLNEDIDYEYKNKIK